MKKHLPIILAFLLTGFALLTLFLSSAVIFDLFGIRAREGNYVPFVVWANFACSITYLLAVYGLFTQKHWTAKLLLAAATLLALAFVGLQIHIGSGGLYEAKTVYALLFRIALTLFFAGGAYWALKK